MANIWSISSTISVNTNAIIFLNYLSTAMEMKKFQNIANEIELQFLAAFLPLLLIDH